MADLIKSDECQMVIWYPVPQELWSSLLIVNIVNVTPQVYKTYSFSGINEKKYWLHTFSKF